MIKLEDYIKNHQVCPFCGRQNILDAGGWIECIADPEKLFFEINRNLTVHSLLDERFMTDYYRDFLEKQRSHFRESLVTGEATVYGLPVVLAVSEFYFSGGSMGVPSAKNSEGPWTWPSKNGCLSSPYAVPEGPGCMKASWP